MQRKGHLVAAEGLDGMANKFVPADHVEIEDACLEEALGFQLKAGGPLFADQLRQALYARQVKASLIDDNGVKYDIPSNIWGSDKYANRLLGRGPIDLPDRRGSWGRLTGRVIICRSSLTRWARTIQEGKIDPSAPDQYEPAARPAPCDIHRSGLPGKPPKLAHFIEREFLSRVESGEAQKSGSLSAEALALQDWAKETYPDAPPPTAKTIENNIRVMYNKHVRQMPPKKAPK